jgi:CrcB protein
MSAPLLLAIGLLGGAGAVVRFLVDGAVSARLGKRFPYGILAVNLSGAFALGVLVGAALDGDAYRLLGTGLLGAYTTFSTWMFDAERLATADERRGAAALYIVMSLLLGLAAVWLGRQVGRAL